MIIGNKHFATDTNKYIMAILNVTPDSFSDGGRYNNIDAALYKTESCIEQGAHIIDVGGESTRPGYDMISDEEEVSRVVPVIEAIKKRFDIPISLDTYKSYVAMEGIKAGADMINDIWGLKYDSDMASVISQNKTSVCIMHNRKDTHYKNFWQDITDDLLESLRVAKEAGIPSERIMIDPGIGFAKDYQQNLEILNGLERFEAFNYPILLGTSRKSVIGNTLNVQPQDRVIGTVATTVIGAMKGASFFRVHDVLENKQALIMTQAIVEKGGR